MFLVFGGSSILIGQPTPPVYVRAVGDKAQCLIVTPGASNSNPIQITCQGVHGFKVGDIVEIANVPGNTAANGLRKVKAIAGTKAFTITDMNGANVAGNGVWTNGTANGWAGGVQRAGKVLPYNLKPHPRLMLDPSGWTLLQYAANVENGILASIQVTGGIGTATYTRAHGLTAGQSICVYGVAPSLDCSGGQAVMTVASVPSSTTIQFVAGSAPDGTYNGAATTVSAWAHGANPAWVAMHTTRNYYLGPNYLVPGIDHQRERSLNFALMCYVNRADTNACAVAMRAVTNAEDIASNFGIEETLNYGGDVDSDYISSKMFHLANIYTLVRSQLSTEERNTFARKMLNDLADPVLGGDCLKQAKVNGAGSITKPYSDFVNAQTISGTGTSFLTDMPVGSVILPPTGLGKYEDQQIFITAVNSDTEAVGVGAGWSGPYSIVAPVAANSCGAVWFSKHHPAGPLAHPSVYPNSGGTTTYGVSPLSNTTITKIWGNLAMGLALADDDPRARQLVSDMSLFFIDYTWPLVNNYWTGFSGSGSSYHYGRVSYMIPDIITMFRSSLTAMPDLGAGQYLKNFGAHLRFMYAPNASSSERRLVWAWGADGGANALQWSGGRPASFAGAMMVNPSDPEALKTNFWLRNVYVLDAATVGAVAGFYTGGVFLRAPPTIGQSDYRTGPTQRIFRGTNQPVCLGQGSVPCPADGGFKMIVSRSGWNNPNDTAVGYEGADHWSDHSMPRAGDYVIYKDTWLVAGDSQAASASAGPAQNIRYNLFSIAGLSIARGELSFNYGEVVVEPHSSRFPRWAGGANDEGAADPYVYWLNDLTGTYAGTTLNRLHRQVAHLKKPGSEEYLVLYDDLDTKSGTSIQFYTHYAQNGQSGEGTTSCTGGDCSTLNTSREILTQSAGGTVNSVTTRFVDVPGSPARVYVDNANGSFPGGLGRSFRATACPSAGADCSTTAKTHELLTVHRIGTGTATSFTATPLNPSADWTGLQLSGSTVLFARKGAAVRGLTATTLTHTGGTAVLVTGLAAGNYRMQLNGKMIPSCRSNISVVATDSTMYCDSVEAGTLTVTAVGNGKNGGPTAPEPAGLADFAARTRTPAADAPERARPTPSDVAAGEAESPANAAVLQLLIRQGQLETIDWPLAEEPTELRLTEVEGRVWLTARGPGAWVLEAELEELPPGAYFERLVAVFADGRVVELPVELVVEK